jgi:HEAT repeat protein
MPRSYTHGIVEGGLAMSRTGGVNGAARAGVALIVWLSCHCVFADDSLTQLLDSRALANASNPVPVNYLLNEGRGKLSAADDDAAREQLVAALRLQTSPIIAMMTGLSGSMNTPTGREIQKQTNISTSQIAAQQVISVVGGPDVFQQSLPSQRQVQQMQKETRQAMADPWVRGIEAADAYVALGDAQSAGRFYASCLGTPFGIDWLAEDCLNGVLRMGAPRAYALLTWFVEHPEQAAPGGGMFAMPQPQKQPSDNPSIVQLRSFGLEGLGRLIADGQLGADQMPHAFGDLLLFSGGAGNAGYFVGAAIGLGYAKDPRGIEPLRKLAADSKNPKASDAALRALAIGFNDETALRSLRKLLDNPDEERRFQAAAALFRVGDAAAFDWAIATVTARRAAEDNQPDIRARVVRDLLEQGGDPGKRALAEIHRRGAGNDWLQAWVAVAMLQGGDANELAEVRSALQNGHWTLDHLGAKAWWGRIRPLIQIGLQVAVTGTINVNRAADIISNMVASERSYFTEHSSYEEMVLAQLQWQAADAFAANGGDDTVADLTRMLADPRAVVRMSAARAIAVHPSQRAIEAYAGAFDVDFGEEQGVARAPEIRSALLRTAIVRHPNDPQTIALCRAASNDAEPGVRFIALTQLSGHSDS